MILLQSGLDESREYLGAPLSAHEIGLLLTQSGPRKVVQLAMELREVVITREFLERSLGPSSFQNMDQSNEQKCH
jgi:hypothetical protein